MKYIKLTQGKITKVDDDTYLWASKFNWCVNFMSGGYYVIRSVGRTHIRLHREIIGAKKGEIVDHINGNTLDNRKENLRICTHKNNMQNQKTPKNNKSEYKGVYWVKENKNWRARIQVNGKKVSLGCYKNKEDAAKAYNEAAIKYFGEFARINII